MAKEPEKQKKGRESRAQAFFEEEMNRHPSILGLNQSNINPFHLFEALIDNFQYLIDT